MKHGSLISPDEAPFGFGTPKAVTETTSATSGDAADFITVPDAHLLFSGEFKHSGNDLKIVGEDGKSFLVTDYFKTDKHPTLRSPEGATLSGDLVDLLAGPLAPGQYAQAGAPQPGTAEAVGRVAVVTGNVTIIRNGVAVTVNAGDAILKNDVVQTGAGGTVGLSLNDGSTFNLTGNARLAINEFVYDPNGAANSSLTTLIQGAATFVAGQIAKTGDMKVATPVATMGIRGTAVILDINALDGRVSITVIDQRDGKEHVGEVFDRAGNLIARVTSVGGKLFLTPTTTNDVIATFTNKTPEQVALEFAAFQSVLSSYEAAKQWFPNLPDHTDLNPKGTNHAGGSDIQPSDKTAGLPDSFAQGQALPEIVFTKTAEAPGADVGKGPGETPTPITLILPPPPALNPISGSGDIDGTDGADYITGSDLHDTINAMGGNDFVVALGGDDTIIAGHGGGDDHYDGGTGEDTLAFPSALSDQPLVFHLLGIAAPNNTVDGPATGHDIFTNIERIESGAGDDVFNLHSDANWIIDAGAGFDIVKLIAGLDIYGEDGPEISDFEMVDLTNGGGNIVQFEGGGIDEHNPGGVLRIIGDPSDAAGKPQDVVLLTPGGADGHWEFVAGGRITDEDLFGANDDHSDGVTFDTYVFISDADDCSAGQTIATAYIDKDTTAAVGAPDALVEQGAIGDGTSESTVKLTSGAVQYDLTGWGLGGANIHEFDGHYYEYIHQINWWWTDAHAAALVAGGYLANITSQAENDFVNNLVGYPFGYVTYIGASDTANEGTFVWADGPEAGQAVTFTFWASGEPNNGGGSGENYLAMVSGPGDNEGGRWNDVVNSYGPANGYLVEYPTDVSTFANVGTYGYVTLDAETNELTYHLNDADPDTQALAAGQTVTDSFDIVIFGSGDTRITHHVEFTIHGSNDAPEVFGDVNDEQATIGEEFSFSFGENVFRDADAGDSLTYIARLMNGESSAPLPSWLTFDPETRTFSGTPPVGAASEYDIRVTATDPHGASVSETFTLNVEAPEVPAPVLDLDANNSSSVTGSGYRTAATFGTPTAVLDSDATITGASTLDRATITLTGEGFGGNTDYPDTQLTIDATLLEGAEFDAYAFQWSWHGISWYTTSGQSGMNVNISGNGTTADYLQILQAARMSFDSDTSNTSATVAITVSSHDVDSNTATTAVSFNAAPDITWSPDTAHTPEDTSLLINGISFGDVDAGLNEQFTVTFKVLHGSITPAFDVEEFGLTQVAIEGDNNDPETSLPYQWKFTGSLADINAALAAGDGHGFNYAPESGYVGNEAQFTFTVTDSHGASDTQILDISVDAPPPPNVAPVLNSFTLNISDNGPTVISTDDFTITDPDSASFFLSVGAGATGGVFEVFNGTSWVSAPTGGFTVDQIAAGEVLFAPESGQTPSFTIWASDGTDAGPAINPTVNFINDAPAFASFGPDASSTEQTFAILDSNVTISDAELDALTGGSGDYNGASLVIVRRDGASLDDEFSFDFTGTSLSVTGGEIRTAGNTIPVATFSVLDGALTIDFFRLGGGLHTFVHDVMQHITYKNTSDAPPASVQLDWTFSDGNTGAQGSGDEGTTTQTLTVNIAGQNDPAAFVIIEADPVTFTETGSPITGEGNLWGVTDPEGDDVTVSVVNVNITGDDGGHTDWMAYFLPFLTIPSGALASGSQFHWGFDSGSETFSWLGAGETLTLDYSLQATDEHGAWVGYYVGAQVVIEGADIAPPPNEAPVISIENADVNGGEFATTLFGLSVSDPDDDEFDVLIVTQHGSLSLEDETVNDNDISPNDIGFHATFSALNNALLEGITYTNPENPVPGVNDTDKVTLTVSDQHGGSDTINFIFNVFGEDGIDLNGTSGNDVIFGTGNGENLAGGGGNDTFVFSFDENQIGNDVIHGFEVTSGADMDKIFFDAAPFATFAQLESQISYNTDNGTATIDLESAGSIILNNVANGSLTADHFIIHPGTA